MNISTTNRVVACTPFSKQHMETVVKGGFAMVDKKVQLQELQVVMHALDPRLDAGDTVWVRGDTIVQPWAKEVFTVAGREFILVPANAIQIVRSGAQWQSGC